MNNLNNNIIYGLPVNGDGSFDTMKVDVGLYHLYNGSGVKRTEDGGIVITVATNPSNPAHHGYGHSVLLPKKQALELVELLQSHIASIKG
jgi:hypothetical protein